jgi:signal transduction histidine kinase/CheY-like chemotaxis protein
MLHPDDRAEFERGLSESARTLTPWLREFRIVRDDGSVRWLDTFATPERLPDGSVLWHGFTADITARKETEAELRRREMQWQLAAQAARIGLAQMSLGDRRVRLDAQACANHGLAASVDGLTLDGWLATIDPADRAGAQAGVSRLLTDGTPFEGRYRVLWPDGSLRWLEFVVRASHGTDGRIDGLIGTCRDVHEQQAAAQLERARIDAERASRAKSEFLSRLSHELRTPLNGILGFAQLMAIDQEQPLTGRQAQRLASMQHAGTHLLGLINDVLDISRNDGTEPDWQVRSVDLDAVIDSTLGLVQPLAQLREIQLQRTQSSEAVGRSVVLGEPRRIEQVLMNLLSNAIKYSPRRSSVTVRVQRTPDAVRVAVRDEGHGIEAAQLSRLFQPFERLDAERRQIDGVGLGLFIARQLAEAMGGRIEVASRVGVGSTFTLMLRRDPLADERADGPPAPVASQAPPERGVARAGPASPKRILYVEDESLNQLLFQEVVRGRPHWQLHLADDGASGLQLAHDVRPDVMLIDINLPDTTGLALVARLRADERTRGLRCVALSADAMAEQIDAARHAGFDDYWTKPIDVAQVLGRLDELLADAMPDAAPKSAR